MDRRGCPALHSGKDGVLPVKAFDLLPELFYAFGQGFFQARRKDGIETAEFPEAPGIRRKSPVGRRVPALFEINEELLGNLSTAEGKSPFFQFFLKGNAGKRVRDIKVPLPHMGDDCTVAVLPVPEAAAHSVHGEQTLFTRGIYDRAARTHAEGPDAPAHRGLSRQLIVGPRQQGVGKAELGLIQPLLGVFNPKAHGKFLSPHGNAFGIQTPDRVPGAVTDGQEDEMGRIFFSPFRDQAGNPLFSIPGLCHVKAGDLGIEMKFPAQFLNPMPHIGKDLPQAVRPDMGLGVIGDIGISPELMKGIEDELLAAEAVLGQGI